MPFPSPTYLQRVQAISKAIADEFKHFYAQLEGYLRKEHKDDGSHGDVTAESVVVVNTVTAGGAVSGETATFSGPGPHTFGSIQLRPRLSNTLAPSYETVKLGEYWAVAVGDHLAGTSKGLNFFDLTRSAVDPVLTLYYHTVNGEYVFMPRPTLLTGGVALGNPFGFNESYNLVVTRIGYYERGRTVPMGKWQSYTPSWFSSGTQPSVGTGGSVTGRYTLIGNTLHVRARITLGTGFSFGTGTHGVTLPDTGLSPVSTPAQMLTARYVDVGTGTYVQTAWVTSILGADAMPFITGTGPTASVTSSSPFTFAAGDILEIGGTVELG